jgi:serine/threonine protein kinase/WD40 repeat protein
MFQSVEDGDPLVQIAEDFLERYRRGERPPVSEFVARLPDHGAEVRDLLSALVMVEELKPRASDVDNRTGRMRAREPEIALEKLGDYRIVREVGRGGMGVVYEAEQMSLGRCVALKVLSTSLGRSPLQVQRFLREARSAAQLHHTNIVPIFAVGEADGIFYYAMQFIRGHGLDVVLDEVVRLKGKSPEALQGEGATPEAGSSGSGPAYRTRSLNSRTHGDVGASEPAVRDQAVEELPRSSFSVANQPDSRYARSVAMVGIQAADALEYAHRQGTLHRDVKPSNLILDGKGTVWVADFGLAKTAEDDDLTRTGDLVGTLRYMAPERFQGVCDARSDVYALGLTLYELLAFRPAFEATGRERLIYDVTHREPPRLGTIRSAIPRDLETIVHKAIEKEPSRRYQTAGALVEDLRCFLEHRPISARPVGSTERLTRWARRNPGLATLGTAVAGLLALTVAVISFADVRLRREHAVALSHLDRATRAESDAVSKLLDSCLAHARAARRSGVAGRRFDGLRALEEATRLDPAATRLLELRNEAIACLALADIRPWIAWSEDPEGGYLAFDFDPALNRVARGQPSGDMLIHDGANLEIASTLPGNGLRPVLARFSPNGRFLAIKHQDRQRGVLVLWDVITQRRLLSIPDGVHASALDFHPDGTSMVVGLRDGSVVVYELPSGIERGRLSPGTVPQSIRFDSSGSRIAVVSPTSDETLQVRAFPSGDLLASFRQPVGALAVEWHPRGLWLAAGGQDGRIYLYDPAVPSEPPRILEGHSAQCVALAPHPGGELLASASWDGSVRIWHTPTGREQVRVPISRVRALRFSRDGRHLGEGNDGGTSWIWELADGQELHSLCGFEDDVGGTSSVDVLRPMGVLASTSPTGVRLTALSGEPAAAFIRLTGTRDVAVSPNADFLYTSSSSGLLRWPVTRSDPGQIVIGPPAAVASLSGQATGRIRLARDGQTLAVVIDEERGRVAVLDLDPKSSSQYVEIAGHPNLDRLDVSPDGRWVATGTWRGTGVKVWDARRGTLLRELPVTGSASAIFSPDGHLLVTGSGQEYRLWNTESWECVHRVERKLGGGLPGIAAFRDDGAILALASTRSLVQLVDISTGKKLATLEGPEPRLSSELAFSPDGRLLALAPNSAPIWAWDLRSIRQGLAAVGLDWVDPVESVPVDSVAPESVSFLVKPPPWAAAFERGDEHTRSGRWSQAIAAYHEAIDLGDPGTEVWTRLALAHLQDGDAIGYREVCQRLLRSFATTKIAPSKANQIAWACALGPGALSDYRPAIQLSERSVASRDETNRLNTLGAILFRAGQPHEALFQLEKSVADHGAGGTIYDALYLALVHHSLGHNSEAQQWVRRAEQPPSITTPKTDEQASFSWIPRLEVELLRREVSQRVCTTTP